jgi:hypothetical protein
MGPPDDERIENLQVKISVLQKYAQSLRQEILLPITLPAIREQARMELSSILERIRSHMQCRELDG